MSTIQPRRTLPAFTLLAALLITPAAVHARPARPSHAGPRTVASSSFLTSAWHFLTHLWGESGMSIDPNGNPSTTTHSGGSIDPNGGNSPSGDSGMTIDPNG